MNAGSATIDDATVVNANLAAGSPAIHAGLNLPEVTNDYAGAARPQGAAYDIGALETAATASSAPQPPTDLKASVN